MPIYRYRCNDCSHEFEQQQRMTDTTLTDCPVCDDGHVRRVVNSVGVVFKGSGFYVTDNRKTNHNGNTSSKNDTTVSEKKPADSVEAEKKTEKTNKTNAEKVTSTS